MHDAEFTTPSLGRSVSVIKINTLTLLLTPGSNLIWSGVAFALTSNAVLGFADTAPDQELHSQIPVTPLFSISDFFLSHSLTEYKKSNNSASSIMIINLIFYVFVFLKIKYIIGSGDTHAYIMTLGWDINKIVEMSKWGVGFLLGMVWGYQNCF